MNYSDPSKPIAEILSDFIYDFQFPDSNKKVNERIKISLLDFCSAALAGTRFGEMTPIVISFLEKVGGHHDCTVIGLEKKYPAPWAAMANGIISHTVELDDGHRFGTCHPGTVIIPAALAAAELNQRNGKDLLLSIIVGYEAMLRIATAINPSHLHRGFHTTGTCGAIGAAAAAAKLYGLNREETLFAISMAALQGAGLQEMLNSNPMIKPLQSGKSSLAGIIAAELSREGAKSPTTVFEGPLGFFKAMTDNVKQDVIYDKLGEKFEIERTYIKLYPTCRHVQCSLEIMRELMNTHELSPSDVDFICVRTHSVAVREVGKIVEPRSWDEAMFSIPYAISVMLHEGKFTLVELGDSYRNRLDIKRLSNRVRVEVDPIRDAKYPEFTGASVEVVLKSGKRVSTEHDLPPGEPETMPDKNRILEKFRDCSSGILPDTRVNELSEAINIIEALPDISNILEILRLAKSEKYNIR